MPTTRSINTFVNVKQVPAAFVQANTAFQSANNVAPQIEPAFLKANSAYASQNASGTYANSAFITANTPSDVANSATLYANGAFIQANAAFTTANNVAPQVQPAFDKANSAGLYANASFLQANAAFTTANNVAPQVQPAFDRANAAFNKANSAVSRESFLANTGQTLFTTNGYNIGYVDVFVNGIKLYSAEDFTATDGANVSISQPTITQNDVVEIINWGGTAEPISRVDQYARDLSNVSSSISNTAIVNANLSYLHANAAYNVANTLIASSIDLYARPHANASFNHANSALLHANSAYNKANSTIQAFANFYYSVNDASGDLTIANTGTYGATMGFNVRAIEKNIVGNVSNYTWTHGYTGYYMITTTYRQTSGGDVWTCLAICKNGPISAVGISARTGSEDSHNENYSIIYPVDDISATYQLQHWSGGGKSVAADMSQGNPGWTNYATLHNNRAGDTGRMVDYIIRRLGDL